MTRCGSPSRLTPASDVYIALEYVCASCGARFESFELRAAQPEAIPHPSCGGLSLRVISAPAVQIPQAAPPPHAMDTRALAEGMPLSAWKKARREKRIEERRAEMKRLTS